MNHKTTLATLTAAALIAATTAGAASFNPNTTIQRCHPYVVGNNIQHLPYVKRVWAAKPEMRTRYYEDGNGAGGLSNFILWFESAKKHGEVEDLAILVSCLSSPRQYPVMLDRKGAEMYVQRFINWWMTNKPN